MGPDLYSTDAILGVIAGLKEPVPALLGRYCPTTAQDESETIHFDLIKSKRRISPFVSPVVAGKVVNQLGYITKTFQPAYVKDKRIFDPTKAFKRRAGERIGGSLSAQERADAALTDALLDQLDMLTRREEVMVSEALRTGKVTVSGDGYATVQLDFERHADLVPSALTGDNLWTDPDSKPLDWLQDNALTVLRHTGTSPNDVVLGVLAWKAFREHADVTSRLDTRRVQGSNVDVGAQLTEGLTFRGEIDGFRIFTYAGWYVNLDTDEELEIWPSNVAGLASAGVEGVRFYGAIKDPKAGLRAQRFFAKMWDNEDPAVRFLMMQSAPLTVLQRVDAAMANEVVELPVES